MKHLIRVVGSIANDSISVYDGDFGDDDKSVPSRNYFISQMISQHGGTGANIAYGLKQHIQRNSPTEGDARLPYGAQLFGAANTNDLGRLERELYPQIALHVYPSKMQTATATIITDKHGHQVTAFFPGAMGDSIYAMQGAQWSEDAIPSNGITIVSPTCKRSMIRGITRTTDALVVFDPGQQVYQFTREELLKCLGMSDILVANSAEAEHIEKLLHQSVPVLLNSNATPLVRLKMAIVTRGSGGQEFFFKGQSPLIAEPDTVVFYEKFDAAKVNEDEIVDPTGCGDAWRAGFFGAVTMYATNNDRPVSWLVYDMGSEEHIAALRQCAAEGSMFAAACVRAKGPQSYADLLPQQLTKR